MAPTTPTLQDLPCRWPIFLRSFPFGRTTKSLPIISSTELEQLGWHGVPILRRHFPLEQGVIASAFLLFSDPTLLNIEGFTSPGRKRMTGRSWMEGRKNWSTRKNLLQSI